MPHGFEAVFYPELESTNLTAVALAKNIEQGATWVIAGRQTGGRGRRGRIWTSETGNLYCSLLWRPNLKPSELAPLPYVIALAVRQTVIELGIDESRVKCKWPNDVLVDDKKICGILIETSANNAESLNYLVIGIGINLMHFPDDAQFSATSIYDILSREIDAKLALEKLSKQFDNYKNLWFMRGFDDIRREWTKCAWGLGEPRLIRTNDDSYVGRPMELMEDGGLLVVVDGGHEKRLYAGDVFPLT